MSNYQKAILCLIIMVYHIMVLLNKETFQVFAFVFLFRSFSGTPNVDVHVEQSISLSVGGVSPVRCSFHTDDDANQSTWRDEEDNP